MTAGADTAGTDRVAIALQPPPIPPTAWQAARTRFPPRAVTDHWSATEADREQVWQRLTPAPFVLANASGQKQRRRGLGCR